jgi:hypothetical protein
MIATPTAVFLVQQAGQDFLLLRPGGRLIASSRVERWRETGAWVANTDPSAGRSDR